MNPTHPDGVITRAWALEPGSRYVCVDDTWIVARVERGGTRIKVYWVDFPHAPYLFSEDEEIEVIRTPLTRFQRLDTDML